MTTQNNAQIFGKATNGQTDIYKTRDVVITYLNVTFEDPFSKAPTLAKIEFGGEVFTTSRVLYLFVRSSLCRRQHLPKMSTLFCLVLIK